MRDILDIDGFDNGVIVDIDGFDNGQIVGIGAETLHVFTMCKYVNNHALLNHFLFFLFVVVVCLEVLPSKAQGILLALLSVIVPEHA